MADRPQDVPDYARTYDEFWKELVENPDGSLNRDQVMRELHDYRVVMHEVALAYDDATGGRLSKPNTAAQHIISAVDERIEDARKETREEVATEARFAASQVGRHPDFDWDVRTLLWFADRLGGGR